MFFSFDTLYAHETSLICLLCTGFFQYLYALKVKPVDKMSQIELCAQPPDVTDNPYFDTLDRATVPKPKESV